MEVWGVLGKGTNKRLTLWTAVGDAWSLPPPVGSGALVLPRRREERNGRRALERQRETEAEAETETETETERERERNNR